MNRCSPASSSSQAVSSADGAACTAMLASMPVRRELGLQMHGQEVAAERAPALVDPGVVRGAVDPEVLVGVDAQTHTWGIGVPPAALDR